MQKVMLIDGSSIFYRAFYAMPNLTAPSGEPTGAVTGFANTVLKLLREINPDFAAVAMDTSRKTFRTELFSDYKGNRAETPSELIAQLEILNEFTAALGLKTLTAPGYEADDILGTLSAQASKNFFVYIVTGDRDALQLINQNTYVYFLKGSKDVVIYDGQKFFDQYGFEPKKLVDFKALNGDTSDNIPGVKGIGEKTAAKLIKEFGTLEDILADIESISSKKVRAALQDSVDIAKLCKKLAQIDCEVPMIKFVPQDFKISPSLQLVDEFCRRYGMKNIKAKVHEMFDAAENLFGEFSIESNDTLEVPEVNNRIDVEKILTAESLSIVVDFDTQNNIQSAAIKVSGGEIFPANREQLLTILNLFKDRIIVHSLKKILHSVNIENVSNFFDVELAAYLIYPERENYSCAELLMTEGEGLTLPEKNIFADVTALEILGKIYVEKLQTAELSALYENIELPLTKVLANMEMRGVYVDSERLNEKSAEMEERIAEIEKNIYSFADEEFNINSPKQLAEILFEKLNLPVVTNTRKKTKSGISTNVEVLEKLRYFHPIIEEILNFRLLTKLKSTYLDGIKNLINRADNRVHTNFNQTVTATGRLSSSDPNLQNIPVRSEEGRQIRALFEPGEGYDYLLSADYSQIELRLLAHMSGDENLIDAFKCGQDIHARTAAEVFSVSIDEVTADLRRKAKAVNFGIVYGISDYGLSLDLHTTRQEAAEYIRLYFNRYPKVKEFLDATIKQAHADGYVKTLFDRRRVLPDIKSTNFHRRGLAERMAMNTPIQGSAADIIKLAMIRAEKFLSGLRSRIILQVHDELVIETTADELEQVEKCVRAAMENVVDLKIPLPVDIHHGKNWALAK